MTRRRFLLLCLASAGLSVGCTTGRPARVRLAPTPEATATSLAFPRPAPSPSPAPNAAAVAPTGLAGEAPAPNRSTADGVHTYGFRARTLPPLRIVIPAIELESRVVQIGVKADRAGQPVWETAAFAVGHHFDSANPGQPGNVVLSGHISSPREGAVFHRLPDVAVGDGVVLGTAEQQFLYRVVDRQIVQPGRIDLLAQTPQSMLTLLTCFPDGIYSHRLVVQAHQV